VRTVDYLKNKKIKMTIHIYLHYQNKQFFKMLTLLMKYLREIFKGIKRLNYIFLPFLGKIK